MPLAMLNRHGLIAGATGTGKTKTLQLIAEQLSAAGVPVVLADLKGDLAGLAQPGTAGGRVTPRAPPPGGPRGAAGVPGAPLGAGGVGGGGSGRGGGTHLRPGPL